MLFADVTVSAEPAYGKAVAFIAVVGFAIQQAIRLLEPLTLLVLRENGQPAPASDAEAKELKAIIAACWEVALGLGVALSYPPVRVLAAATGRTDVPPWLDVTVTALVVGAGAEFANSATKFAQYVKDALKPRPPAAA